jgi:hypothetical protein
MLHWPRCIEPSAGDDDGRCLSGFHRLGERERRAGEDMPGPALESLTGNSGFSLDVLW